MNLSGDHNGWVVVGPASIEGLNPVNYHVLEVKIERDEGGKIVSVRREKDARALCTKSAIKQGAQKTLFLSESESAVRNRLAQMQNDGLKVCGICASRFYADDDGSAQS